MGTDTQEPSVPPAADFFFVPQPCADEQELPVGTPIPREPRPPSGDGFLSVRSASVGVFRFRLYHFEDDLLLAASDEELIGRSVTNGEVEVHISEQFYGTEAADQGELRELLGRCTVANLMGERCVKLARELGFVDMSNVVKLDDVWHAQLAVMR